MPRINPLMEDRHPPEEITHRSPSPKSVPGSATESPYDREVRLRNEAAERLKAKFGSRDMRNQAVGSSPYTPSTDNDSYPSLEKAMSDIKETATQYGSKIYTKVQEAHIGEHISSGLQSLSSTLNDPNLNENIKEKAQQGWSWLSSTASSLWSAASSTASEIYTSVQSGQFMKTFEMGEEEDEASTGASKDDPSMGNKKHEPEQANEVFDEESWMKEQLEAARKNIASSNTYAAPKAKSYSSNAGQSWNSVGTPVKTYRKEAVKPTSGKDFFEEFGV